MSNEGKTDEGGGGGPWGELRRLADEVRVKLHLMNMEVKQRWAAVEPKLAEVQAKVEAKTDQATGAVQEHLLSVVDGLRKLLEDLRGEIDGSKKREAEAKAAAAGEKGAAAGDGANGSTAGAGSNGSAGGGSNGAANSNGSADTDGSHDGSG